MYPITKEMLEAMRNDAPQSVKIKFAPKVGEELIITGADIRGTFEISRASLTGDKIEIGSAVSSTLKFTLENYDKRFENVKFEGGEMYVEIFIDMPSGKKEKIPMGYFLVGTQPKMLDSIKIEAYDRMARFNRLYDSTLSYPATVKEIKEDCCRRCGVLNQTKNMSTSNIEIPHRPKGDNLTYRQVLIWVMQIEAQCAYMCWDGALHSSPYKSHYDIHEAILPSDRFISGNTTTEEEIEITGCVIRNGQEEYTAGTKDYAVLICSNGLLQNGMDLTSVAKRILDLKPYAYFPIKCTVHSFPHIYPLDRLHYVKSNGDKIATNITNVTYRLNQGTILESRGRTAEKENSFLFGGLTSQQKSVLESQKQELYEEIESAQALLLSLNETITNSMGYYVTQVKDENGGIITYTHDKTKLEDSRTIYCKTSAGFFWTNTGWNNGKPHWTKGVDKNGNAIMNIISVNKLYAEWIEAGMLTSKTGKFKIDVDTGKCEFSDIRAIGTFTALGNLFDLKVSNETIYQGTSLEQSSLGLFKLDKKGNINSFVSFEDGDLFGDSILFKTPNSLMGLDFYNEFVLYGADDKDPLLSMALDGMSALNASTGIKTGMCRNYLETALTHAYGHYNQNDFIEDALVTIFKGAHGSHDTVGLKVEDLRHIHGGGLQNEVSAQLELYTTDTAFVGPDETSNAHTVSMHLKSCGESICTITIHKDGRIWMNGYLIKGADS